MPYPDYEILTELGGATPCEAELHTEIEAAGPYTVDFQGVSVTGAFVMLHFDGDPSVANKTTIDAVMLAHDQDLVLAKAAKVVSIDEKTVELISNGFVYSAKTFSLSLSAQSKMTAAHQIKDHLDFVYPVVWNNIDDTDAYSIADTADMDDFYMAAIGTIRTHLDSGTVFKDAVRAAADIAAVDAVVDNR